MGMNLKAQLVQHLLQFCTWRKEKQIKMMYYTETKTSGTYHKTTLIYLPTKVPLLWFYQREPLRKSYNLANWPEFLIPVISSGLTPGVGLYAFESVLEDEPREFAMAVADCTLGAGTCSATCLISWAEPENGGALGMPSPSSSSKSLPSCMLLECRSWKADQLSWPAFHFISWVMQWYVTGNFNYQLC